MLGASREVCPGASIAGLLVGTSTSSVTGEVLSDRGRCSVTGKGLFGMLRSLSLSKGSLGRVSSAHGEVHVGAGHANSA